MICEDLSKVSLVQALEWSNRYQSMISIHHTFKRCNVTYSFFPCLNHVQDLLLEFQTSLVISPRAQRVTEAEAQGSGEMGSKRRLAYGLSMAH